MNQESTDLTMELPDGRTLGYAEFGERTGPPLIYLHGWPGSRLEGGLLHEDAVHLGLRIISPERPGYGLSTPQPNRTLLDWANDIEALADHLDLERFIVTGMSGGAPFSLALASKCADRIRAGIIICGLGPLDYPEATRGMLLSNRILLGLAKRAPWLARILVAPVAQRIGQEPQHFLRRMQKQDLCPADQSTLRDSAFGNPLATSMGEAFRPGIEGAFEDGLCFIQPWGFSLREIRIPFHLWYGEADRIIPPHVGHYLATQLPNCQTHFIPDEGHFSLGHRYGRKIVNAIINNHD